MVVLRVRAPNKFEKDRSVWAQTSGSAGQQENGKLYSHESKFIASRESQWYDKYTGGPN